MYKKVALYALVGSVSSVALAQLVMLVTFLSIEPGPRSVMMAQFHRVAMFPALISLGMVGLALVLWIIGAITIFKGRSGCKEMRGVLKTILLISPLAIWIVGMMIYRAFTDGREAVIHQFFYELALNLGL